MCALDFLTGRPIGGIEVGMMVSATLTGRPIDELKRRMMVLATLTGRPIDESKRMMMCANTKYDGGHPNFPHNLGLRMISCDWTITTSKPPM